MILILQCICNILRHNLAGNFESSLPIAPFREYLYIVDCDLTIRLALLLNLI
ncbi:MAG: hypothetical protein FWG64_10915 [Firmicutes bacterium]|nr:hypothetical protein [Bacillota bacterium]